MTEPTAAEKVEGALREVVGIHGPNVGDDGIRLRELLTAELAKGGDSGPDVEIDALIAAGELGLPRAMARGMSATTAATGMQGSGISAGLAIWVATAWAKAVSGAASTPSEPPAPPLAPSTPTMAVVPPPTAVLADTAATPPTALPPATAATPSATLRPTSPSTLARPGARSPARPVEVDHDEGARAAMATPAAAAPASPSPVSHRPVSDRPTSNVEPVPEPVPDRTSEPAIGSYPDAEATDAEPTTGSPEVLSATPPRRPVDSEPVPPTGSGNRRPAWLLPAAMVAILALVAGGFVVTRSSTNESTAQPSVVETTTAAPDTVVPDTVVPDTVVPDTVVPDTVVPDTVVPDTVVAAAPDATADSAAPTIATSAAVSLPSAEGMVQVPLGTYPVGSEKPDLLAESKRRNVDVAAFYIDRHEVTNADYQAFVDQTGAAAPLTGWTSSGPPDDQLEHPVRAITFDWATAYCQSRGKRLPTEVEWEVAAGGSNGDKYSWGNDLATVSLPIDGTYPVESIPEAKSSMGVFDLTGSVWEWVGESYDPNKVGTGKHVLRGGQNGYIRNNWSRLPVDEKASNAVLGAGIRCAASEADGKKPLTPEFLDYARPADPVAPAVTIPPGYKSFDDFSGSKLEWLEVSTPEFRFGYHPNKYFHLETKKASTTVVALCPCITPPAPIGVVASGEVEPTLSERAGTFEWGVIIRADESPTPKDAPASYVALVVDPRNRRWRAFVRNRDGKTVDIGQAQLNSSEDDTVTLELRDLGTKIEYFINGTYRGESPAGASLPKGNHAGFTLSSDVESTKVHIHYGSFAIKSVS